MGSLGYHVIIWDLDTDDYNNDSPQLIENSKRNVRVAIDGTRPADRNFMSIAYVPSSLPSHVAATVEIDPREMNQPRHSPTDGHKPDILPD
jgi:hypothetical protein